MNDEKNRDLEARGWTFGDAEDFLEMTPFERKLLERVSSANRKALGIAILAATHSGRIDPSKSIASQWDVLPANIREQLKELKSSDIATIRIDSIWL